MEGYENIANIANIARDPEVTATMTPDPDPCKATRCNDALQPLELCEKERHCCHAWTKRARIDRRERDLADAKVREANGER